MNTTHARIVARVVARAKEADLSPPLGQPGGPCHVMKRIQEKIRNPNLRDDLIEDVSHGHSLSNSDAAKIYPVDHEHGAGIVKQLVITSHAQYRMDLRGVTVDDVRRALANHGKVMNDLKSQKHPGYERMLREVQGGKVQWTDLKTDLFVVVDIRGSSADLITTYWKGTTDPKAVPPTVCGL